MRGPLGFVGLTASALSLTKINPSPPLESWATPQIRPTPEHSTLLKTLRCPQPGLAHPSIPWPLIPFFFFSFWIACRVLVPQPGIEPTPLAVEVKNLNHWTSREVPNSILIQEFLPLIQSLFSHFIDFDTEV